MLGRKYVFETRATKVKRRLLISLALLALFFVLYSAACLTFIIISSQERDLTLQQTSKIPIHLISVFTGDRGRIGLGLQEALQHPKAKVILTGVNNGLPPEEVLERYSSESVQSEIESDRLIIDRLASNTVENVFFTLRYLKQHPEVKNVLIISHDYHIARIKIIFNKLRQKRPDLAFYYLGKETNYRKWRNLKILFREVFKLMKTMGFLMLWDNEGS